ncbi:MAG: endonuclease MutS2, partial [Sarcina sp.]
ELIKKNCVSGLGRELIDNISPTDNLNIVERRLNETSEGVTILDIMNHVPLYGISNIKDLIDNIEKGMTVEARELIEISNFFRGCRKLKKSMVDKESYTPMLYSYCLSITELENIEEEIEKAIKGNRIADDASKELKKTRRLIENCEEKIQEKLKKFLSSNINKEYIQEFFVSQRDGRFTIPIKTSYKNHVQGEIVEISSKGSTVFIEPSTISKHVSELNILRAEESIEEYRILAEINNKVFEYVREIKLNIEVVAQFDMIFAKAKYSKSIRGIKPQINNKGYINIIKGKHPLLGKDAVPLDFEIGSKYRSMIITGPNAGGKTIVLKTVGILTLAVQSGFHIAAHENTNLAIFRNIFVDIGDNQSIENSLSTFSSHMKNLSDIIRHTNNKTLILSDEIGSGTEPNEGAGIAIAILEEFYKKGGITVATTHYGEIKRFSENHDDFENAAMQFESETLKPLYKLLIGKSGKSNALWISKRMGIDEKILARAKNYIENKDYNYEKVRESKIKKNVNIELQEVEIKKVNYAKGDRVNLLDDNKIAIVYKGEDNFNNIVVYLKGEFKEVNVTRVTMNLSSKELYPEGYDIDSIFTLYKERKLSHDIERGSKKALKKIQKEIRNNKNN